MSKQNTHRWSKSTRVRGVDAATQRLIDQGHEEGARRLHLLAQEHGQQILNNAWIFIHATARERVERAFTGRIELTRINDQWSMASVPKAAARAVLPQGDQISPTDVMYVVAVQERRIVASFPFESLLSPSPAAICSLPAIVTGTSEPTR